jgi:hypothetical protein
MMDLFPVFINEQTLLSNRTLFPATMHTIQGSKHAQPPFICIQYLSANLVVPIA